MNSRRKDAQYFKDRQVKKQKEANLRQRHWDGMSAEQQLATLDTRLGKGVGASRQRARIQSQMEQE